MGAEDDQWHGVIAHGGGQVQMGVTTKFFTILGSAYAIDKKDGG